MRDLPGLTFPRYVQVLADSFAAQGCPTEWAPEVAQELLHYARSRPVESVIERNLDYIGVRFDPSTGALRPRRRRNRAALEHAMRAPCPAGWPLATRPGGSS